MKRKALVALLIGAIVIAGATGVILSQTENQVENQTCEVKITGFNWTGSWGFGAVGTLYGGGFNVTLHNLGNTDVEGVKVEVKLFANDSELWSQTWFKVVDDDGQVKSLLNPTFRLNAGEIRVFNGTYEGKLEYFQTEEELTFKVICMSNSTVLDELTLTETEDRTYDVEIAGFKWTSSWGTGGVGLLWGRSFNVTLQNLENRDIEGLSVEVKLLANNIEIPGEAEIYGLGIIGYTADINYYDGRLNASETRELRGYFETSLDKLEQAQDRGEKNFTVRVMMNDTILNELMLPFS